MAPSSRVPTSPAKASAGEAGAVVPTPEGCQPVANWASVEDQLGKGTNWPTTGSLPPRTPLVPMTTTRAAASQVVSLTRPLTRPGPRARARCRSGQPRRRGCPESPVRPRRCPAVTGLEGHGLLGGGQLVGVGAVEPVLEDPAAVGGQAGAAPDLEEPDLLVAEPAMAACSSLR